MKKKGILPLVTTWMELEGVMLSEISQTRKDKYSMGSPKKKKKKKLNPQKQRIENRLPGAEGVGETG